MNLEDTARLLTYANGLDSRNTIDEAKVASVYEFLLAEAPDMEVSWAKDWVTRFYARNHGSLTLDGLISGWRDERSYRAIGTTVEESTEPRSGMPDWFRKAMMESFGHADLGNVGQVKKSGAEIQAIFDRHNPQSTTRSGGLDAHCGTGGCACLHESCYKGWIDSVDSHATAPCPVCRTELAEIVLSIPDPENRLPSDSRRFRESRSSFAARPAY
jgi:hypothetical protein